MATKQSVKLRRRARTCATLSGWSGIAAIAFVDGWVDGYAAAKLDAKSAQRAARKKGPVKRGK